MKAGIVTAIEALRRAGTPARPVCLPDHRRRGDREPRPGGRWSRSSPARRGPCSSSSLRSATARSPRRARGSPAISFASAAGLPTPATAGAPASRPSRSWPSQIAAVHRPRRRGGRCADERRPGRRRHRRQRRRRRGVGAHRRAGLDRRRAARLERGDLRALSRSSTGRVHRGQRAVTRPPMVQSPAGAELAAQRRSRSRPGSGIALVGERVAGRLGRELRGGGRAPRDRRPRARPGSGAHAVDERVSLESLRGAHVARWRRSSSGCSERGFGACAANVAAPFVVLARSAVYGLVSGLAQHVDGGRRNGRYAARHAAARLVLHHQVIHRGGVGKSRRSASVSAWDATRSASWQCWDRS